MAAGWAERKKGGCGVLAGAGRLIIIGWEVRDARTERRRDDDDACPNRILCKMPPTYII